MAPEPAMPTVKEIAKILIGMDIKPKVGFEIWELALIKARKWVDAVQERRKKIAEILKIHEGET